MVGRSPSWGAWIEIGVLAIKTTEDNVAPPRGERGLKYQPKVHKNHHRMSLPLVGSVD